MLTNAGVSQELRMELTGHSGAAMHHRYPHHELEPPGDSVGKLRVSNSVPLPTTEETLSPAST